MPNFQIAQSGVEPGTYGGLNKVPCIKVDKTGRITFADNIDISTMLSSVEGSLNVNVNGNVTGDVVGSVTGNVFTNAISSNGDISITVNSELRVVSDVVTEGRFRGTVLGDLYGDVTGSTYGLHTGALITDLVHVTHLNDRSLPPQIKIETEEDNQRSHALMIKGAFPGRDAQSFLVGRSRGTLADPKPLEKDDIIYSFEYLGADADSNLTMSAALFFEVDDDVKKGAVPSRLSVVTSSPDDGWKLALGLDKHQVLHLANNLIPAERVNTESPAYLKISIWTDGTHPGTEFAIPVFPLKS